MEMIVFQVVGVIVFLIGTLVIGRRIRCDSTKTSAERLSRVSHALFWCGLVLPEFAGAYYPGLTSFDRLIGIPSLPYPSVMQVIGLLILLPGLYFLAMSNLALNRIGFGFAAFKLTQCIVAKSIYERVRNPMSLGTYMAYLGISLIADSSYLLIGTLAMIIPVHLFNLAYFEEYELLARHGVSYSQYMQRVPFILPRLRRAPKNLA